MKFTDGTLQIHELEQEIAHLPIGSISKKTIQGKEYYYHRWYEGKKRKEKYLPQEEVPLLRQQIERRKALERELTQRRQQCTKRKSPSTWKDSFFTYVRLGESLAAFSEGVRGYQKRSCYETLRQFVYGPSQDRVFILYGLRRTGKTTLIRQILANMSAEERSRAAFLQLMSKNTLAEVNQDLRNLERQGYRYLFLDEVTQMEDFIEGAALFSDVFATCGMKLVLSGTDSLGFLFAQDEQLYDRCELLHTTFIPYGEFERVLGICGIDEYIRFGGTMSLGGKNYNETSPFATKERTDEYVDSAIARNIQHSLRCYQYEGHFRNLQELYEKNELTSAINRVIEDINHRFTIEVLTREFRSGDLSISARNLRRDREHPTDILDCVDTKQITAQLKTLLDILNREEQTVPIQEAHRQEIREYLELLDLVCQIDVESIPHTNLKRTRTVLAQPGMRYAQAESLVSSLLLDETFNALSLVERNRVLERIRDEIKGRMMEDIVLLETKLAHPKKQVFVLQFPVGEFDMVVFDPQTASCELYEIKHSAQIVPHQYRHLVDEKKCADTEHRYGTITGKFVLYRGESQQVGEIFYQNVEEYLCGLNPTLCLCTPSGSGDQCPQEGKCGGVAKNM